MSIHCFSKQIVELDVKISELGSNEEMEKAEAELLDDVEKLEANLEVTKDYYAKRETQISTQLGTEAIQRAQNQSLHETQKAREQTLRHDLTLILVKKVAWRSQSCNQTPRLGARRVKDCQITNFRKVLNLSIKMNLRVQGIRWAYFCCNLTPTLRNSLCENVSNCEI